MKTLPLTRRQRDILEFVRSYQNEHQISPTLEEIAQNFGLNKVTIFGHVSELERKGVIARAAKGVSRGLQLLDGDDGGHVTLPVKGTIAAGLPIETIESDETLDFGEFAERPNDVYVLRVKGDSMIEDAICDGDMVIVERRSAARDGETVVAVLPDEEATLKRFYRDGDSVRLQPANSTMDPIVVDDVEIRGVVVGVVRKY